MDEILVKHDPPAETLLLAYYGATVVFMALDYLFGLNVRLTFLDAAPGWRFAYYLLCFLCFGLMLWKPGWRAWVSAGESLLTLSLIILSTALRVIIVSDDMIETGRGYLGVRELVNFVLSSTVVYASYVLAMRAARNG